MSLSESAVGIRGEAMVPLSHYLILGAILFSLGVFGALTRRNAIAILMSIELMLNAVNLNFIAFARYQYLPQTTIQEQVFALQGALQGQVFAIFVITVAAAEAAVGLAIVLGLYRNFKTVNVDEINLMKW